MTELSSASPAPRHTVIVGGVAGGMSTATRLRRRDEHAQITVIERSGHVSFANCGLPYYLGGVIDNRKDLLLQTPESLYERFRLDVLTSTEVTAIDRGARELVVRDRRTGDERRMGYDALVLSPGAEPVVLPIPGIERALSLRTVEDTDRIYDAVAGCAEGSSAVIAGGGFIGVEVAENLSRRGLRVNLVEYGPQIMGPLDPEMAAIVEKRLVDHGVTVHTAIGLAAVGDRDVTLTDGSTLPADLVIAAAGVRPATGFAAAAGLETLANGALVVDRSWRTTDPLIFAVGDAVAAPDFLTGDPVVVPLAQTANRDGRLVADVISGDDVAMPDTFGTSVLGIFGLQVASTGWTEKRLIAADIPHQVIATHPVNHAGYYPGATGLSAKLLVGTGEFHGKDLRDRILGAQIVGEAGADKRIDIIATAMQSGRRASELRELELAYAPQFSSAKDPVNMLGYVADNLRTERTELVTWDEVGAVVEGNLSASDPRGLAHAVLVDVRTTSEFAAGSIPGAKNIPLDGLRDHLDQVRDLTGMGEGQRPLVVFCQVGQRGHVAESILRAAGFPAVYNLTGGYRTWTDGQRTHGSLGGVAASR